MIPAKPDSKCSSLKDYFQHSNSQCEVPNGDGEGAILRRLHGDHLGAWHGRAGGSGGDHRGQRHLEVVIVNVNSRVFCIIYLAVLVAIVLYKPKHFYMHSG